MNSGSDPTERRGSDLTGGPGELRPIPDPTVLTTAQLNLAISNLREYLMALITGRLAAVETRFVEGDKAVKLLQDFANKSPSIDVVDGRVTSLASLHAERMARLEQIGRSGFEERERLSLARLHSMEAKIDNSKSNIDEKLRALEAQIEKTWRDLKTNVDAAFGAADKAVNLQNSYFREAMGRIEQLFTKQIESALTGIGDLKERIGAVENRTKGAGEGMSIVVVAISTLFALIGLGSLLVHFGKP
jgi:predicted negative regulator of RcsB-dependent stress response